MGYTSVRKCILIDIRTKFNLIHEKEWTGDTISNICRRYDVSRKKATTSQPFVGTGFLAWA
jgi:hypothetical protein